MFKLKTRWIKIAESRAYLLERLGEKELIPFNLSGKAALLILHQDSFYMVKNKCPHQGVPLTNAVCSEGHIICPYHRYGFDLKTGRGAGLHLENYPVEEREDGIYAGVEYLSWF
ncbi:MAG: Rieske 2Fe-2S domain-containing protein [Crocinitomicaceae bacterium]|nr:Rieske 2Fe-2S domain-containing protein [Crocinitomicaceae bacterium]